MDCAARRHRAALDRNASGGAVRLNAAAGASIAEDLRHLSQFGATPHGIDRRLFTAPDHAARSQFAAWALADGRVVTQDAVGNVFARRPGVRADLPVLTGSHLDTVPTGGAYDGAYGAVAALWALRHLDDDGVHTAFPLEAVAWAGEEGSRFPLGCLGSGAFSGLNDLASVEALCDEDGITFAEARAGTHGLLAHIPMRKTQHVPSAYVELHIEQGPVLEHRGVRLGNVTAIAGQRRFEIDVTGESGHAGTVPMPMRHDALAAASEIVLALEAEALEHDGAVLTVGRLVVEPNQTNVIPARVLFRVDARSVDDAQLARLGERVVAHAERVAQRRGVRASVREIERRAAVAMDFGLRVALGDAFEAMREPALDIASGAGHDAMCIATIAPAAMIFVPSAGGRSHVGNEYTSAADLDLGVAALANALVAIDRLVAKER
jgi:hydantoinase/carbamoylase family amidase